VFQDLLTLEHGTAASSHRTLREKTADNDATNVMAIKAFEKSSGLRWQRQNCTTAGNNGHEKKQSLFPFTANSDSREIVIPFPSPVL
jgi:hypothetical protein